MPCTVYRTIEFSDLSTREITAVVTRVATEIRKPNAEVRVHVVGEKRMKTLNTEHRGVERSTDVLSFPLQDKTAVLDPNDWGDIFLAPAYIRRQARRFGVPFEEEFVRMLIHGTLHLFGYDHDIPQAAKKMFALQERLLSTVL